MAASFAGSDPASLVAQNGGALLVTSGFFLAYFWVLRHPQSQPFVMPLSVVDNWIGFASWAVTLYLSLWLYVGLLPALYDSCRDLLVYLGGSVSVLVG
jgi:hypothetical protein